MRGGLIAALGAIALFGIAAANAAAITNTATLRFGREGQVRTIRSNTTTLMTQLPPTTARLDFMRHAPGAAPAIVIRADGAQCRTDGGAFAPIDVANGDLQLEAVPVLPTRTFRAEDMVFVRLEDGNRNLDPGSRETVDVRLTSPGDEEVLRLRETAPDSGIFTAPMPTTGTSASKSDCRLSVGTGGGLRAGYVDDFYPADVNVADALIDPYGYVFSSEDGAPVDGAIVTLIADATGRPAAAFGDDGLSEPYPNSVTTGGGVTTNVRRYDFPSGGFRFPLLRPGSYRLSVAPPAGFRAPSEVAAESLRLLIGPDGQAFSMDTPGSYGGPFPVLGAAPIKIDLPVDPVQGTLVLVKSASTTTASVGDFVQYLLTLTNRSRVVAQREATITDTLPQGLRFQTGSFRIDGAVAPDPKISPNGRTLTIPLGEIAAGRSRTLGYVTHVGPGTSAGDAINSATAQAGAASSNRSSVSVRIRSAFFDDALTIVGRITEGVCALTPGSRRGVAGIRIAMEDGTYVVSDPDGQFHFEGVRPGTHVVQIDLSTLPTGYEVVECARNSRSAGRSFSRFVEAQGGSVARADFFLRHKSGVFSALEAVAPQATSKKVDWFAGQAPGAALLFPTTGHNPRAPSTRVVVKHLTNQRVKLTVNGEPADVLGFDGTETSLDNRFAISSWRTVPLRDGENIIRAEVGGEPFESRIFYSNTAARAVLVPERSLLIADGVTRPVIAVRIIDRTGQPVRASLTGGFRLRPPYLPATEADMQQERQLAGLDRFDPTWRVTGDDGIALIELQPTTQTGTAELEFDFQIDRQRRTDKVRVWLAPAARDWMVVGFAAGTVGFNTLTKNSEKLTVGETHRDGQVTLYAKGRINGQWVLTLAYDSERRKRDAGGRRSLLRVIDPDRYYTVYGDRSTQGYDAASAEKLYLRLERPQFYALFGDYETGLTESRLSAYSRALTGAKAEYRGARVAATAFAAETDFNYRRDEIQGSGLSGPYPLTRRDLVLNSERVKIETRDRFRFERIIATKLLTRHIDYDIDYDAGTLLFREPILSRDRQLNAVFIVAEYETFGRSGAHISAGTRFAVEPIKDKLAIGATAVREGSVGGRTDLGGVDVRYRHTERTEVRLEAAATNGDASGTDHAYLAEAMHRGEWVDAVAYVRQQDTSFGLNQQNRSEGGTRKYGVDGRIGLARSLDVNGSAYREEYLASPARRDAANVALEYRTDGTTLRAGLIHADDIDRQGDRRTSTLVQFGAMRRLLDGRLDLSADSDLSLGGAESIDFPARHRLGATYAFRPDVRLVARHEISDGADFDSAVTQFGIDAAPWAGARLATTLNQQAIAEGGQRSYAALGLSQSLLLGKRWSIDLSIDSNRTFNGGIDPADILNPEHPPASGGHLQRNAITDDFTAASAGVTYRSEQWSWTGRLESRNADSGDQSGATTSLLRQIGNGVAISLNAQAFRFEDKDGSRTTAAKADMSLAFRPPGSRWSILDKLELRMDQVENGVIGGYSPFGRSGLSISGDAKSWRIVNNVALNRVSGIAEQQTEISLFYGSKYVLTQFDAQDFKGFSHLLGIEARLNLLGWLDIGLRGSVRHSWGDGGLTFAVGPSIGVSPFVNAWISLGYNIIGFRDRDFEAAQYTRDGWYIMMRIKFDQQTPRDLGLGVDA